MIDIEISTYWNVETLYYVFNGVASIMGGDGFTGLLKMVFLFAILIGMFAYAGNKQLEMATWFIQALIFVTLLNLPIARVAITDRTGLEPPRTVDNVPFALALVAQTTNVGFGWATRTYETVFGVPDELGLQKGDVAFGHRILKNTNKAIIRDPGLKADLMQFFKECTLYDVKDGVITPDQIIGQTDTWTTIFTNTSPARYVTYNTLTATPITDTCTNVAVVLKGRVDAGLASAQAFYGRQNFTRADTDAVASAMFASSIGTSYDWILGSSATASDAMKQAMFNNVWREAGSELPALMGDTARIQELQTLAGAAQAARQADGSNSTLSMLAQETLPHMRNWLEAIIYAMFPVVVVLMVVVSQDGAKKVIGGYMMSLAWIGMWPVMFAVINHLSLMHLRHKMAALNLAATGGVPFQLSDTFDATLGDELAAIGYLVVLVPFISGAIIKMGQGGFMSVADRMVSGFSSAGAAVGSGMANGNVSMGQAGLDTASVNTTSMHKFDNDMNMSGGGASIGYGNGDTGRISADGTMAFTAMQNQLLTRMNLDERSQADLSHEGHTGRFVGTGQQDADRGSRAATFTEVKGHDNTRGNQQHSEVTAGVYRSGQETGQHTTGQRIGKTYDDNSSFRHGAGVTDTGYMGLNVSGGAGSGGGAGVGADPTKPGLPGGGRQAPHVPNPAEEKRIADAMKKGNATQGEIDKAIKNYRSGATETVYREVTDDYGNLQRIPIGQQKPAETPRAEPKRSLGAMVGGTLGLNSQRQYTAEHGRAKSVTNQHGENEDAQIGRGYAIGGQRAVNAGTGSQSAQSNRDGKDASRSDTRERSHVEDLSVRQEAGTGDKASRSESHSATISRDLMADPHLLQKVAARNGMTAARMMGQSSGEVLKMVKAYAAERGMFKEAQTMPTQSFAGEAIPDSKADLDAREAEARKNLPKDTVDAKFKKDVGRTGYTGTAPVKADTTMPAIVTAAEGEVRAELNPDAKGSIPQRAAALDENVHAFASPDKEIGAGRANPAYMTEQAVKADMVDFGEKLWDKVKGGDGMADGEKLNENKRRETSTDLQVNTPTKKQ